jgi:hypothetical protein
VNIGAAIFCVSPREEVNAALPDPKMEVRFADIGGELLAVSPADFVWKTHRR